MSNTANTAAVTDLIPVRHHFRDDLNSHRLTIDVPNAWDDVRKICKKVLTHDGRNYKFIGWNSDRNECFFAETFEVASVKKR